MMLLRQLLNRLSIRIGGTQLMVFALGTAMGSLKTPAHATQGGEVIRDLARVAQRHPGCRLLLQHAVPSGLDEGAQTARL